jgi:carbon-monoxide dehydrogenase iron sulfur subunit
MRGVIILKIAVDIEACYGCRICELACSFHHGGVFSPELSSIRVAKCNRTGQVEWSIGSTCDSCKGEAKPLCVEYCAYGALKEIK